MQVTLHIPDETAALLKARGVEIPAFVEEILIKEAHSPSSRLAQESVAAAIDRILERRKGLSLQGLKIRDLIDEGRKY